MKNGERKRAFQTHRKARSQQDQHNQSTASRFLFCKPFSKISVRLWPSLSDLRCVCVVEFGGNGFESSGVCAAVVREVCLMALLRGV